MLITGLLLATKLVSAPAKAMVTLENTRKVTVNLFNLSRQFISNSLKNQHDSLDGSTTKERSSNPPVSTEYLVHNWLEAKFAMVQMLILWHEPISSMIAISSFLGLFLLIPQLELKLYPTIFIAIFVYNLTKVWFRHIWPEIRVQPEEGAEEESLLDVDRWTHLHPQLITLAEFRQLLSNLIDYFKVKLLNLLAIRREKPIDFFVGMLLTFFATATIGREISGFTLIFSIISVLILAPGIYLHLLPKSVKDYISQHILNIIITSPPIATITTHTHSENNTLHQQLPSTTTKTTSEQLLIEPATTTINETPASLSLFEHLKQVSFLAQRETTSTVRERPKSEPVVIKAPNKKSQSDEQDRKKPNVAQEEEAEDSHEYPHKNQNKQDELKSSDDLSSNDSASLIDFDDDQHDGFVIL